MHLIRWSGTFQKANNKITKIPQYIGSLTVAPSTTLACSVTKKLFGSKYNTSTSKNSFCFAYDIYSLNIKMLDNLLATSYKTINILNSNNTSCILALKRIDAKIFDRVFKMIFCNFMCYGQFDSYTGLNCAKGVCYLGLNVILKYL